MYDIDRDPGEQHNLAATHRRIVDELTGLGTRFDKEIQAEKE